MDGKHPGWSREVLPVEKSKSCCSKLRESKNVERHAGANTSASSTKYLIGRNHDLSL